MLEGSTRGASTDLEGSYEISGLEPGLYNLEVIYLYKGLQNTSGTTIPSIGIVVEL